MTEPKGYIVCLEGIDGSGKDTQLKLLASHLEAKGQTVQLFTFPDYGGPLGECISAALRDQQFNPYALQLLLSAERLRQLPALENALHDGIIILTSRYKWSGRVYAAARGMSKEWANNLELPLPAPSLTVLLDLEVKTSILRTGGSDVLERDAALLNNCRKEYLSLACTENNWKVIDASLEPDVISSIVTTEVLRLIAIPK